MPYKFFRSGRLPFFKYIFSSLFMSTLLCVICRFSLKILLFLPLLLLLLMWGKINLMEKKKKEFCKAIDSIWHEEMKWKLFLNSSEQFFEDWRLGKSNLLPIKLILLDFGYLLGIEFCVEIVTFWLRFGWNIKDFLS